MKKLLIVFFLLSNTAQAGSVAGTGGGLETTQLLNYAELYNQTNTVMQQLTTQISQLERIKTQMESGSNFNWSSVSPVIGDVARLTRQGQSIGYDSQVMARRWDTLYPDFNKSTDINYSQQYGDWSKEVSSANRNALMVNGLQAENFASEEATRTTLEDMARDSNNKQSQVAVMNAANHIALGQMDEMRKLRQIQMSQNSAQTTYLEKQNSVGKKAEEDAEMTSKMFDGPECAQFNRDGTRKVPGGCTRKQWADWHNTH